MSKEDPLVGLAMALSAVEALLRAHKEDPRYGSSRVMVNCLRNLSDKSLALADALEAELSEKTQ